MNERVKKERSKEQYNLPVIGYFPTGESIRFNSILEAEAYTGINYHLIFENTIGKIRSAQGTYWEYVNGVHWLRYKARYIRQQQKYTKCYGISGGNYLWG